MPTAPSGRLACVVVIVTEAAPIITVYVCYPVLAGEELSVAWAVKVNVPACVGVPCSCPAVAPDMSSVSPGGTLPVVDQVYGPLPPSTRTT